ncbi:hypothetical protein EDF67_103275 [Sphingobacterium sp. JUb78]|nr:hypothetical protein EDF67_103275 [Sphingobacterium sp. JUb78]
MHCNGSCFLMKALRKEADRKKAIQENFSKSTVLFCFNYFPANKIDHSVPHLDKRYLVTTVPLRKVDHFNRLLRPPTGINI